MVEPGQPVPKGGGVYRVGKPYQVAGRTYTPEENSRYRDEGLASWYGDDFHGRLTANGEIYDMEAISAAHPTLPMPSYVRVTNVSTRKSLIVRVNDRGPYHAQPRDRPVGARPPTCSASAITGWRACASNMSARRRSKAPTTATWWRPCATARRRRAPVVMVASNRFLPNFGRAPAIRSGAPLPQERPYDLGEGDGSRRRSLSAAVERRDDRGLRARRWRAIRSTRASPTSRPTPSRRA